MKNPKAKGAAYERAVCKALSLWLSHGEHEDWFWRSAMSGGRSTVARKRGVKLAQHAGDITATHPGGEALTKRFFIECKSYKSLAIESFIFRNTGVLAKFWQVAYKQAISYDKVTMMIVKQNGSASYVLLDAPGRLTLAPMLSQSITRNYIVKLLRDGKPIYFYDFDALTKIPFKK